MSESAVARRTDLPAKANVLTRAQAIPIIAHDLRTQQIYLMHPIYNNLLPTGRFGTTQRFTRWRRE